MRKNKSDIHTKTLHISNDSGMHCRPSASFVKVAQKFKSTIFVEKNGERVNGKSIMGLMMLAAENGTDLNVEAEGPDAVEALDALEELVDSNFEDKGSI